MGLKADEMRQLVEMVVEKEPSKRKNLKAFLDVPRTLEKNAYSAITGFVVY